MLMRKIDKNYVACTLDNVGYYYTFRGRRPEFSIRILRDSKNSIIKRRTIQEILVWLEKEEDIVGNEFIEKSFSREIQRRELEKIAQKFQ